MSSLPEYSDITEQSYKERRQRKTTLYQAKLFEENRQAISAAERLEGRERVAAYEAYKAIRASRKHSGDKDIALYHYDKSIQIN